MGLVKKCLHQIFRSKPIYVKGELINPCAVCEYDPKNNPKCSFYSPIKMGVLEVEEIKEGYKVKS